MFPAKEITAPLLPRLPARGYLFAFAIFRTLSQLPILTVTLVKSDLRAFKFVGAKANQCRVFRVRKIKMNR
jgi:hypothetical protein